MKWINSNWRGTPSAIVKMTKREILSSEIMPAELVLLAVTDLFAGVLGDIVACLNSCTSQGWLVISEDEFSTESSIKEIGVLLDSIGVSRICVRQKIEATLQDWQLVRSKTYLERSATGARFEEICKNLPANFQVASVLTVEDGSVDGLFPALGYFSEHRVPFIFLDVTQIERSVHLKKVIFQIKDAFVLLRIKRLTFSQISFYSSHWVSPKQLGTWNAITENIFSGPSQVAIDVANTCTHNCSFCGLYGATAMNTSKLKGGGKIDPALVKIMSLKIDTRHCLDLITSLPHTVSNIQFGGLGDPDTHPHLGSFIEAGRMRGFKIEILTNFAYMSEERIQKLHSLVRRTGDIQISVNLSAATPETYIKIRPNQKKQTFDRVIRLLRYVQSLKDRDGYGLDICLLMVTCRDNFREMKDFVSIGSEVGVRSIWIKPVEIHGEAHLSVLPSADEKAEYAVCASETIRIADQLGVPLQYRDYLEGLAQTHGDQDNEEAQCYKL